MTGWEYEGGIRTRAVDEFIVLAQTLRIGRDRDGNVLYYNQTKSTMENYMIFLCRDRSLDPTNLTQQQEDQLQRLRNEMMLIFGGSRR